MSDTIEFLNSLYPKLNFREVRVINEISRYSANINGLTIDIFEKKNGFGMEFRGRTVDEKKTLTERLKTLNLTLSRKDFVFYPWPRKLSLDQDVLKNRLAVLVELATADSISSLSKETLIFLKNYSR
jgi:hypothetical protein